jgi:hypothetical protein
LCRETSVRGCSIDFSDANNSSQQVVHSFIGALENIFETFSGLYLIDTIGKSTQSSFQLQEISQISDFVHFGQPVEEVLVHFPQLLSDPVNLETKLLMYIERSHFGDDQINLSVSSDDWPCASEWSRPRNIKYFTQGEFCGWLGRYFFEFTEDNRLCAWGWNANSWNYNHLAFLFSMTTREQTVLQDFCLRLKTYLSTHYTFLPETEDESFAKWEKEADQSLILFHSQISYQDHIGHSFSPDVSLRLIFYKPQMFL